MIVMHWISYWTLIGLCISTGYVLHGIVGAIKDGTFFDWGDEDSVDKKKRR